MDEKHFGQYFTLLSAPWLSSDGLLKKKLKVKRLKNQDVSQAAQTLLDAQEEDPLSQYIRDTPDAKHPKWYERVERLRLSVIVSQWVVHKWGLTIDHGRAVLCDLPAPEDIKRKRADKYYFFAIRLLDFVGKTKQQRKRLDAASKAIIDLVETNLGDDIKKMRAIPALAAEPELQGPGCDALVTVVKEKADHEERSVWVLSSIPQYEEFFQSEGFESVAETLIGEDDPTWDQPPVRAALLVRTYKGE